MATSTTSASSVVASPPAAGSIVTLAPAFVFSTFATFMPSRKAMPCFSSMRWNCFATLVVHAGQDAVQELDDFDVGAEALPHRAEFEPDDAAADDEHLLRHRRQRKRAFGGDDDLLVDLDAGQASHVGAGGDADRSGLERLRLARPWAVTSTLPGAAMAARTDERLNLVLLEEERDAVDVRRHRIVLVLHHRLEVELRLADDDAERGKVVGDLVHLFRRVEQRLRGDAADVEAGAAEIRALLDHRHLEPELRGADRTHVTARAGADDDEVVGHGALFCSGIR